MTGLPIIDDSVVPLLWTSLTGVLTGLLTSVAWLWWLRRQRPRFLVSPWVARRIGESGRPEYLFKLVNLGSRDIIDIKARAMLLNPRAIPGGRVSRRSDVPLVSGELWRLARFRAGDANAEYAYRFRTSAALDDLLAAAPDATLVLDVRAYDEVGNFTRIERTRFKGKNAIVSGEFEFGASLRVVPSGGRAVEPS